MGMRRAKLRPGRRSVIVSVSAAVVTSTALILALAPAGAPAAGFQVPPVRHVFVIVLENENYATTFGDPSADPYLASTLPQQGALLDNYYATGHESNDNYISILSGQPPNAENQADCQVFDELTPALMGPEGVASGEASSTTMISRGRTDCARKESRARGK